MTRKGKMVQVMGTPLWNVPPMWEGETVYVLGGGPSLTRFEVAKLDPSLVLAINNAWELIPECKVLYFADRRWYDWNKDKLAKFQGEHMVTRCNIPIRDGGPRVGEIKRMKRSNLPLSHDPSEVSGWDSGSNSVNIAFLAGAKQVVLLGFDMRPGNWHKNHRVAQNPEHLKNRFIPSLTNMSVELRNTDCSVLNATPNSALKCFPFVNPRDYGVTENVMR